jgi:hypothetical protein
VGETASLTGLQSPHTNMGWPSNFLKEPVALGLWTPHLKQLIVPIANVRPLKGEPATLDLYLSPSSLIAVVESLDLVMICNQLIVRKDIQRRYVVE